MTNVDAASLLGSNETWRMIGSIIGAGMAFLVAWPENTRDFARRVIISIFSGLIFAPALRQHFGWGDTPQFVMAAAVACALFSWFAIAAIMRILKTTDKIPK